MSFHCLSLAEFVECYAMKRLFSTFLTIITAFPVLTIVPEACAGRGVVPAGRAQTLFQEEWLNPSVNMGFTVIMSVKHVLRALRPASA
jgi:hypothetical protein